MASPLTFDLQEIIENDLISTHYQPLVSLKRGAVFGVEALSRGIDPETGEMIPPDKLFEVTVDDEQRLELDRACRRLAIQRFKPLYLKNRSMLLSINVDASVINHTCLGSQNLLRQVKDSGISPNNVIIEIIESNAGDLDALIAFVIHYRKNGFVIALDDVGAGFSNLDRIPLLTPDILKLDRSLCSRVDRHFHKLEVVKAIVKMAQRIGAIVLAEGVERSEEVLTLLEIGVDVFQGFHFGRPAPLDVTENEASKETSSSEEGGPLDRANQRIQQAAAAYKLHSMERFAAGKRKFSRYDQLIRDLCDRIALPGGPKLDRRLTECLEISENIGCLYIMDTNGIQVSSTICNPSKLRKQKRFFYEPARMGADHSLKEYYLPIRAGLTKFTTEAYISLASGNRCLTISQVFYDSSGEPRVLCVDIGEE
ncbi:MAG: EAL domain-containing protein [Proteobacteria bacterium]|nr:EAL domain-containing protein [Pseudomonadota bacterium]